MKSKSKQYEKAYNEYLASKLKRDELMAKCDNQHGDSLSENCTTNDGIERNCDERKLKTDKSQVKGDTPRPHKADDGDPRSGDYTEGAKTVRD